MSEHLWYQASGVLNVTPPLPSARSLPGGDAGPGRLGSWSPYVTTRHPNSDKLIEGFKWDERTWYQESTENIAHTVPVNWDPTTSGVTTTYFQSGIGDNEDLEFSHAEPLYSSGLFSRGIYRPWCPVVFHGHYYDYEEEAYLYSDDSEVVYVAVSGLVPGIAAQHNQVRLASYPKIGVPIRADRYRWNNAEGKHDIDLSVRKVAQFTGLRDEDGVRQDTWNERKQEILWDLIDPTEPEFMVVDSGVVQSLPYAVFNQQMAGRYPAGDDYDQVGVVTGTSPMQQFHTTYAPIDSTMPIEVYSYLSASGVWTSWAPIAASGAFTASPSSYEVKVDPDLGILEFGSLTASGINIPSQGHTIVTKYNRSLRVEYEPQWLSDYVTGLDANLNPVYRTNGRGFVYLSTRIHDATQITLTATLPSIGLNLFGPVYIGNTYVPVTAKVTDDAGIPVEGAGVEIYIESDPPPGRFGSFGEAAFAISNNLGEAKAYYNPPTGIKDIGETVTYSNFTKNEIAGTTTMKVSNLLLEGSVTDVFIYKILTNDPILGWYNPSVSADELTQKRNYMKNFFEEEGLEGPTGLVGGDLASLGTLYTSAEWERLHREAWELLQAELYAITSNNGRKVLCATYDASKYNPHTFDLAGGAVAPFQPVQTTAASGGGYDVTFDTSYYDLPIPSGSHTTTPSGNLYGYFMVAPTTVTLRASTYNSRLNQTVYSNAIRIKLQVPSYLCGMWYIDAINETHLEEIAGLVEGLAVGSGVPLGFRLKSPNITLAAALDGVTFLDVNPTYNAPIWDTTQPETAGEGIVASGVPYVQHKFNVT